MISAVLDEAALVPTAGAAVGTEYVALTTFLHHLRTNGLNLFKQSSVWEAQVGPDLKLMDIAFTAGHLDEDVRILLMQQIHSLPAWDPTPDDISTSREYVTGRLYRGEAWACVVLPCRCDVVQLANKSLHLIGTTKQALNFFRDAIELGNFSEDCFIRNCVRAFPNLHLRHGIENQIGRFSIAYGGGLRKLLASALTDLNDLLPPLLRDIQDLREVVRQFNAQSSFAISPESGLLPVRLTPA
jgi:hypothetical protein